MKLQKGILALILILTLNSCKGQNDENVKVKIDTKDVILYKNDGIKDKTAKSLFAEGLESVDNQNFEKAKEKFIEADKIERNNPIILNGIAQAETTLGNVKKSNEISLNIISIDSTYTETYSNLGQNYLRSGEYEKAKEILIKGLKYTSDNDLSTKSILILNLSIAYLNLRDCNNAEKYSSEVIEISRNEKVTDFARKVNAQSKDCK
ncbi:tetratricopeptide (TPR) repeat protein [Flavobacterium sp. 7E]|uniref:tetratricopeptide repeat protein n=1 Tax=Flavobacterium sp. 7E TaxID=2735898 RepID=UPI00156D7C19|nr:tetratricopeptide repeat protein [Flavobacterium sp. 7E]NRS87527.1 tetratricopeptide (TPR) repeat protein [Flavobacterium sp. 7E]